MAYWIVNFKSRSGTLYRVKVGGKTGSDAALLGAADPFYTQEDTSEDKFVPVRLQSGYLRIVDDGYDLAGNAFDWHALIPTTATSRPVTLYKVVGSTETVMWLGFLRPETFSSEYLAPVQEREFPVCCCLSVLEGFTFDVQPQTQNFAWLLYTLLFEGENLPITDFYFTGTAAVHQWLYLTANTENMNGKYNYLQVLQEVCRFWGWTARTWQGAVVFEAADDGSQMVDDDFLWLDSQDLYAIATGDIVSGMSRDFGEIEMDGDEFASTNNSETILQPVRKVTVDADVNKVSDYPAIPYDLIEKDLRTKTIYRSDYGSGTHQVHEFTHTNGLGSLTSSQYQTELVEIAANVETISSQVYGAWFDVVDWYSGALADKKTFDWKCRMEMRGSTQLTGKPYFRMQSQLSYSFNEGAITLSATTYVEKAVLTDADTKADYTTWTGNGTMTCKLKVGNKYWNGSAWTQTESTFTVVIGNGGEEAEGKGSIVTNRTYESIYDNYEGLGIPVLTGEPVGGQVLFEILTFTLTDTHGMSNPWIVVEKLKIGFVQLATQQPDEDTNSNTYTASNDNQAASEVDVKTIFASYDDNKPGFGLIAFLWGEYVENVVYQYGASGQPAVLEERPEQHLADRIAAFGQTDRRLYKLQLRANELPEITPLDKVTTCEGVITYPISISRSWRDDTVEVYMVELSPYTPPTPPPPPPGPVRVDLVVGEWKANTYINYSTGRDASASNFSATNHIALGEHAVGQTLHYSQMARTQSSTSIGMAFYNASDTKIAGERAKCSQPRQEMIDGEIVIPEGAVYAAFTTITADIANFHAWYEYEN